MLNSFQGSVESDPMRIPAPSRSQGKDDRAFASELDRVTADEPAAKPIPEAPADIDDELAEMTDERPLEHATGAGDTAEESTTTDQATDIAEGAVRQGMQPAVTDATETQRRGEPGRRNTAGKGTDSPRTSSTQLGCGDALAREMDGLSDRAILSRVVVASPTVTTAAAQTSKGAGEPHLRGMDATSQRTDGATARAVKPSFCTSAKASAEMIEHARDSIFKQILLKITGEGGEMRMRLDPPELGQLDLRMTVENGNRVSLVIATERTDMADMIQRHVAELAETFASVGLELSSTDVHTRDASGDAGGDERHDLHKSADGDAGDDDIQGPKSGGYIRADGLDFWV